MRACLQAISEPAGRAAHAEGLLPWHLKQQPLFRRPAQPRWRADRGAQRCRACSAHTAGQCSDREGAAGEVVRVLECLLRRLGQNLPPDLPC